MKIAGRRVVIDASRRLLETAAAGRDRLSRPGRADALTGPTNRAAAQPSATERYWTTDNEPSRRWPLYTRGNVGEVFPDVVLPLTWQTFGPATERGWRQAFVKLGLLMDDDFDADEPYVILGVFGGYCYLNASYVRMLGVRAPGGSVEVIDRTFFGESDAPAYRPAPGDRNLRSTARLGRTVLRLLATKELPELLADQLEAEHYLGRYPGDDAPDDALLDYLFDLVPLFERLFARHIEISFGATLLSSALSDVCTKLRRPDLLVSLLTGIGDVASAAPALAMWTLARQIDANPAVADAFDHGLDALADRLAQDPDATPWFDRFTAFLDEFGSRGPNEWDLGSDPWAFRPELALAAIGRMRGADADHDPSVQLERLQRRRQLTVSEGRKALNLIDRLQFDKALRAATVYAQGRERSKTTIIAGVHAARCAQRELARRIAERGGPTERWHCCLYQRDEFAAAVADPVPFNAAIAERVARHARLSSLLPPFIVDAVVPDLADWPARSTHGTVAIAGETFQGIAGCPGVARGRARIVLDAGEPGDLGPGDVLVAPITDPSWTPLFLAADAVVVDMGSTISHAVIVSRELGIPCVVSAVGATGRIAPGSLIEVDGNTGTVTILEPPEHP